MKKIFCIPKEYLQSLKKGASKGDLNINKLIEMSSAERRAAFEKYLPKEYAAFTNAGFEKAISSSKVDAIHAWVDKTFNNFEEVKKNDITDKIKKLEERGVISEKAEDAFYEDLVADELGIYITREELVKINKIAGELEALTKAMKIAGNNIGAPQRAWFKKRREMINYINEINPSHLSKILSSTVSRTFLLASFKSPVVNVVGNTVQGTMTALTRRLETGAFRGANPDLVKAFVKENIQLFKETGSDMSRMESLTADSRILGETIVSSQGKGNVRAFSRFMEKIVFEKMLGLPDVIASSIAFGDSLNLNSTTMAKEEGLTGRAMKARARDLMLQAMSINPSGEAAVLRERAMSEAYYSTFTNESFLANVTLEMRKLLNTMTGDARLGDQIIPFAKTPANVVATSIDHSGLMIPVDSFNLIKGIKNSDAVLIRKGFIGLSRAGFGFMAIAILSSLLDPDDYVSEYADYFPKEKQLMAAEGAGYNSLKIGGKWISLDYFGPLAAGLVGYMNAKKHGKSIPDAIAKYYAGAFKQVFKIPGFQELSGFVTGTARSSKQLMEGEYKKILVEARDGFASFLAPRVIPAVMGDLAATMDDSERRKADYKDEFKSKIPGLRETLQPRITMFGEDQKTQPGINPLLYGSRIKVTRDNKITDELNRLSASNQLPSISAIEYSSKRIKEIKSVMPPDEFTDMLRDYGTTLNKQWNKLIDKNGYKKLEPEKQRVMMDRVKNRVVDIIYYKYLKKYKNEIKELRKNE